MKASMLHLPPLPPGACGYLTTGATARGRPFKRRLACGSMVLPSCCSFVAL